MAGRTWDETLAEQLVDEHPDPPIAQVMADQADLVEVVHELHQVVNLKGDMRTPIRREQNFERRRGRQ